MQDFRDSFIRYVQTQKLNVVPELARGTGSSYFLVQQLQSFLVQGFSQQSHLLQQGSFSGILLTCVRVKMIF